MTQLVPRQHTYHSINGFFNCTLSKIAELESSPTKDCGVFEFLNSTVILYFQKMNSTQMMVRIEDKRNLRVRYKHLWVNSSDFLAFDFWPLLVNLANDVLEYDYAE